MVGWVSLPNIILIKHRLVTDTGPRLVPRWHGVAQVKQVARKFQESASQKRDPPSEKLLSLGELGPTYYAFRHL